MLYWIYIAIAAFISIMLLVEMFREKDWRGQVAIAMILMVCVLRVLRIK